MNHPEIYKSLEIIDKIRELAKTSEGSLTVDALPFIWGLLLNANFRLLIWLGEYQEPPLPQEKPEETEARLQKLRHGIQRCFVLASVLCHRIDHWEEEEWPPEEWKHKAPKVIPPIEIFISYAHEDERLRKRLEKHLSSLKRQSTIASWHDRKLTAGKEWKGEIDEHLNVAGIILLLVSADFLASDYCYDVEMKRALQRHDTREARVIPVILKPVDWKTADFGKLQALPKDAKPVTQWANQEAALADVAEGIRRVVEEIRTSRR